MIAFTKRNILLFFRDKSSVFFSLLSVFIIIGLYALFLGDVWTQSLSNIPNARQVMDCWIMAGLLGVTSVTTTMGAFGIMVEDKTKKIQKDILSSPMKRSAIAGGYILSSYIIGVIMCVVACVPAQLYILLGGGSILPLDVWLKVLGLILITTLANTAIILYMVTFFQSNNAFSTASTIIGTLIGFITGIYLPVGNLPETVQWVVRLFPISHGVALFRQVMMEAELNTAFGQMEAAKTEFGEFMGVTLKFGSFTVTPLVSIAILLVTTAVFFALSVWNISRRKAK